MPLYEDRRNAENNIKVSTEIRESIIIGGVNVAKRILEVSSELNATLGRKVTIAFDGWYGIDWNEIIELIKVQDTANFFEVYIPMSQYFQSKESIDQYKKPFITDDPAFGYVNHNGKIEDILDQAKIEKLKSNLNCKASNSVIFGCGSAVPALKPAIDVVFYFDRTRQSILWKMWDGQLIPFGCDMPMMNYNWKEYYYSDYHMLDHQKEYLYDNMDYWVEAINVSEMKIMPSNSYDEIIKTLLKYPVKEIKIYQPGPWGAYRYRDLFDVPGLECNAWNELAGPELGMIVDLGDGIRFEMPMLNLMRYQKEYLGEYIATNYPRLFPLDVWLDDGYFPTPEPIERTAMPIHNHPSSSYIKRNFNEPLGRYETYYICEAYKGACTIMGYKDDADLEQWENLCRESNNLTEIENWKDYMSIWDSNIGDLYLIPPGTAHGHGGNQMVLEMDTCPSISATEYSFFEYDFARKSWDDNTKTMTGKPLNMHLEHGFDNEKWRREGWVKDHLLAKPIVEKWTKDYKFDQYTSIPEMPFEIERFHFYTKADNDTTGKFAQIVTLTIGKKAIIQSKSNPEYSTNIETFQSAIIPASFGEYEIISEDGGFCEVVQLRWKKG